LDIYFYRRQLVSIQDLEKEKRGNVFMKKKKNKEQTCSKSRLEFGIKKAKIKGKKDTAKSQ
jgi:hypothetical protein